MSLPNNLKVKVYCRSRDYTICISQPLTTRSQFIYGYRTKHRQILKTVGMPHRKLHTSRLLGVQKHHSDAVILFVSSHNKRAMNNTASVALFGHIA